MLIVNADDWGRSMAETDAALRCHARGHINSVTAMVHMDDAERAADLARSHGLAVGLHLNYTQMFSRVPRSSAAMQVQQRLCNFLGSHRWAGLVYHPGLRQDFVDSWHWQIDEFERLYGQAPTHVDGHHHQHLCANVLLGDVLPAGLKVRRHLHFWPGEKGWAKRSYWRWADARLARCHRSTDHVFALSQCLEPTRLTRVLALAGDHAVEVLTHPINPAESRLLDEAFASQAHSPLRRGSYVDL
ncbi:MAG: hypothetical protein RIQ60_2163 [Pseudomonadota bacterium]|jgi:predicted glycoside hydrolase/deacetylase ChbG (UPF0249 family)